jgi:hypothetical protein
MKIDRKINNYRLNSSWRPQLDEAVEDLGFFREISQAFLRERGPDNVPRQVFHRGFFPGMDAGAAKNLKPEMPPGFQ